MQSTIGVVDLFDKYNGWMVLVYKATAPFMGKNVVNTTALSQTGRLLYNRCIYLITYFSSHGVFL